MIPKRDLGSASGTSGFAQPTAVAGNGLRIECHGRATNPVTSKDFGHASRISYAAQHGGGVSPQRSQARHRFHERRMILQPSGIHPGAVLRPAHDRGQARGIVADSGCSAHAAKVDVGKHVRRAHAVARAYGRQGRRANARAHDREESLHAYAPGPRCRPSPGDVRERPGRQGSARSNCSRASGVTARTVDTRISCPPGWCRRRRRSACTPG